MKFAKPFLGVPDGEIYPVQYEVGDDCPPELQESAIALEAIEVEAAEGDDTKSARTKK